MTETLRDLAFGSVFEDATKHYIKLDTSHYCDSGEIAIIDQGDNVIAGFTDAEYDVTKLPCSAIVFGDHTRRFKFIDFPFCIGADGVKVLWPKVESDTKYLFHYLRSLDIENNGYSRHFKFLKRKTFTLPPLAEQQRIAAILDKAEEIKRKREQAIVKLDELAQSTFVEMFGDPATNSKLLPLISLGELGTWHSGGTPSRANSTYFGGEIPWFSSGELNDLYTGESNEKITSKALVETATKLVKKGSLLLGMYDTAALKSSIAAVDCSCNQAIAFAEIVNKKIDTIYAYFAIQFGKEHFRRLQRGVRQKNLNLDLIKQIRIPCPTNPLQTKFLQIYKQIKSSKEQNTCAIVSLNRLITSLQNQAFTTGFNA